MLIQAEFAYNNSDYAILKMLLFKVLYSFNPELAISTYNARGELAEREVPAVVDAIERLKRNYETLSKR